ncbi:DUF2934 domain-containing protein [bacterium]|nr:DUF2934 domain-containing protein [bacterium]
MSCRPPPELSPPDPEAEPPKGVAESEIAVAAYFIWVQEGRPHGIRITGGWRSNNSARRRTWHRSRSGGATEPNETTGGGQSCRGFQAGSTTLGRLPLRPVAFVNPGLGVHHRPTRERHVHTRRGPPHGTW